MRQSLLVWQPHSSICEVPPVNDAASIHHVTFIYDCEMAKISEEPTIFNADMRKAVFSSSSTFFRILKVPQDLSDFSKKKK